LYQITDNSEEAVKIITHFYSNFHSTRFVKDVLVIRMKKPLPAATLEAISRDFASIMVNGKAEVIQPTPDEVEDKDNLELARIAFPFNRRDYGKLRQLINVVNGV
jgi:hypothetical protein